MKSNKITKDEILSLARLTKLELSDKEVEQYTEEISDLLRYFEQLDNLDLEDVEPTISVSRGHAKRREDVVQEQLTSVENLHSVLPHQQDNYIQVKRMI